METGYYNSNKDLATIKIKRLYAEFKEQVSWSSPISLPKEELDITSRRFLGIFKYNEYKNNDKAIVISYDWQHVVKSVIKSDFITYHPILDRKKYFELLDKLYTDLYKVVSDFKEILSVTSGEKFIKTMDVHNIVEFYFLHDSAMIDYLETNYDYKFKNYWKLK